MRLLITQLLLAVLGSLVCCSFAMAEDWPQWLGPRGDGISHETGLADPWPANGLKTLWSAEVGIGYSSPVAVEGKVYLFAEVNKTEVLYAFDAASGKEIWKQSSPGGWTGDHAGTRATPVVEGQFIYTYGGSGDLFCRKLADGKSVWGGSILKAVGGKPIQWGQSSSPLIVGKTIIVQGGNGGPAAVAYDKATGILAWKSSATNGSYAHPILIKTGKTTQLIVFAGKEILSLNPDTGQNDLVGSLANRLRRQRRHAGLPRRPPLRHQRLRPWLHHARSLR